MTPALSPRERVARALSQQGTPVVPVERPALGLTEVAERAVLDVTKRFEQQFRVRPVQVISHRRVAGGLTSEAEQAARCARARYHAHTVPPCPSCPPANSASPNYPPPCL